MARFAVRAPGADRCGARAVRSALGMTRAPTPPWPGGPKSGKRRPGAQRLPSEGPPVDRQELRRVRVSVILAWRLPGGAAQLGPGALGAPLKT
jgi:hypothetical protein